jgi:TatD family-associated radical SAM protein
LQTANTKKPALVYWIDNSLYLNITNQCSNNCWFCFRNYKTGIGDFNLKLKREPTAAQVISELEKALASSCWREIVFCGFGEPTAKLDVLLEVAKWLKVHYLPIPVRLDTNGHGYVLNPGRDVAVELKSSGVSKASVSLNGNTEETYYENCKPKLEGGFEAVLDFIRRANEAELKVEVSAIRMPEVDIEKVGKIANELGMPFRVRDFVPCFW